MCPAVQTHDGHLSSCRPMNIQRQTHGLIMIVLSTVPSYSRSDNFINACVCVCVCTCVFVQVYSVMCVCARALTPSSLSLSLSQSESGPNSRLVIAVVDEAPVRQPRMLHLGLDQSHKPARKQRKGAG